MLHPTRGLAGARTPRLRILALIAALLLNAAAAAAIVVLSDTASGLAQTALATVLMLGGAVAHVAFGPRRGMRHAAARSQA